MTDEEIKFKQECEEIADTFMKIEKESKELDRKNAGERKRVEHRKYWLECAACGCKDIRLSRAIEKRKDETWDDVEDYEYYNHDGVGWELDRFDLTCGKCGRDQIRIKYEDIEEGESR